MFAGEAYNADYAGYLQGAYYSGEAAAQEILKIAPEYLIFSISPIERYIYIIYTSALLFLSVLISLCCCNTKVSEKESVEFSDEYFSKIHEEQ